MKKIKRILGIIWKIYFLLVTALSLITLYPFYYFLATNPKHFDKAFKLLKIHINNVLFLAGIRVKVLHRPILDPKKTYVITPNHTSYLDILLLYKIFPHFFAIMGKNELGSIPFFRIFFKEMNILVDRSSKISGKRAMDKAAEVIDKGYNMVIFPEGGIPSTAPKMRTFKPGAFKLAIEKGAEIIPVTYINNHEILEDQGFFKSVSKPGEALVYIHDPISTKGMDEKDLVTLQEKVYNLINDKLKEYGSR
jgi:1-acyl-sn-glycerol-3-phosphate acyltransferase